MTDLREGIHDILPAEYYDDPAPSPSLNASGIKILLESTPAHFKARHPRLTDFPDFVRTPTREQDLGSLVHAIVLGKSREIDIIDANDWRTKEAQLKRDQSRQFGRIPTLRKTYEQAEEIASSAINRLRTMFGVWPVGQSEQTMIWQRETERGPIWCRSLVDHLSVERALILDLKGTGKLISDDEMPKQITNNNAHIQAAHYIDGLETLHPELAGRVEFIFLFVEFEPPFGTRPIALSENLLTRARMQVARASNEFARCVKSNLWPSWPVEPLTVSAPSYLETRWMEEELEAL